MTGVHPAGAPCSAGSACAHVWLAHGAERLVGEGQPWLLRRSRWVCSSVCLHLLAQLCPGCSRWWQTHDDASCRANRAPLACRVVLRAAPGHTRGHGAGQHQAHAPHRYAGLQLRGRVQGDGGRQPAAGAADQHAAQRLRARDALDVPRCAAPPRALGPGPSPRRREAALGLLFAPAHAVVPATCCAAGYECKETEGSFMLAFDTPSTALEWALTLQLALLHVPWPQEVLSCHELMGEVWDPQSHKVRVRQGARGGRAVPVDTQVGGVSEDRGAACLCCACCAPAPHADGVPRPARAHRHLHGRGRPRRAAHQDWARRLLWAAGQPRGPADERGPGRPGHLRPGRPAASARRVEPQVPGRLGGRGAAAAHRPHALPHGVAARQQGVGRVGGARTHGPAQRRRDGQRHHGGRAEQGLDGLGRDGRQHQRAEQRDRQDQADRQLAGAPVDERAHGPSDGPQRRRGLAGGPAQLGPRPWRQHQRRVRDASRAVLRRRNQLLQVRLAPHTLDSTCHEAQQRHHAARLRAAACCAGGGLAPRAAATARAASAPPAPQAWRRITCCTAASTPRWARTRRAPAA